MQDDAPQALRNESVRHRRRAMLTQSHVKPLCDYLNAIRAARSDVYIPEFDPLDGGINAKALFLFASPSAGPEMSGFISMENPDATALNVRALFENAGIDRKDALFWNVVPWAVAEEIKDEDIRAAMPYFVPLLKRMDELNLRAIVLLGQHAHKAYSGLVPLSRATFFKTWMPSPRVFNRWPDKKREIQDVFNEVARFLK